ncbi:MAG: DUF342 domain-containing protein [Kurthia sp.]|nr:DUF342 domain-containing protein [Candidatus Kurthia equi]
MDIFKNDKIEIISKENKIYIKKLNEQLTLKEIEKLLHDYPRIKITSFLDLKKFLDGSSNDFVELGLLLPAMNIQISKDFMSANLQFNEDPHQFVKDEDELNEKIECIASEMGIHFGLKRILWTELEKKKKLIVAEGKEPENGSDAKITYFKNPARKPKIDSEGKADFSDMNFIFEIEKDAWLGEKIPHSDGIAGKNILGKEIPAKAGKDLILKYNPSSVYESVENGITVIRAKTSGVLDDSDGRISILQHLNIKTDIGVETGNVEFAGSITVQGTVLPGYSIRATGDISIEAKEGVSGANIIESLQGDVFIRGGVFGHAKTEIKAGGSVFVKHANEAFITARDKICIEAYSIGSNLNADIIELDGFKGKIIGGIAEAKKSIHTAISGNSHERKTELILHTIDKREKMGEVRYKAGKIKELEAEVAVLSKKITQLELLIDRLTKQQQEFFEDTKYQFELKKASIIQLNQEIQKALKEISEAGKETIEVTKEANQGTIIKIGKRSTMLKAKTNGAFKVENGELNV